MVFKRRDKRTYAQRLADGVYPRGGWGRALYYVLHRLRRLPDPPERIARGIAVGVLVSFTPFFGFHFVIAALLAWMMQGNMLAALLATFFGNPLTFPLIVGISMEIGSKILGLSTGFPLHTIVDAFGNASLELWWNFKAMFTSETTHWGSLSRFFRDVFLPYLVGGLVPGSVLGLIAYFVSRPLISAYQVARIKRLKKRYEKRRSAKAARADARP
ncbi:MAG: DUF2062 domain-containing protein [Paracoccaceae bacterium]|nr:DUF2062 domain-containing protein [Paracoccaceae bacterium]